VLHACISFVTVRVTQFREPQCQFTLRQIVTLPSLTRMLLSIIAPHSQSARVPTSFRTRVIALLKRNLLSSVVFVCLPY